MDDVGDVVIASSVRGVVGHMDWVHYITMGCSVWYLVLLCVTGKSGGVDSTQHPFSVKYKRGHDEGLVYNRERIIGSLTVVIGDMRTFM